MPASGALSYSAVLRALIAERNDEADKWSCET
jgi:hypothetical protein